MGFFNFEDFSGASKAVDTLHMMETRTPEEIKKAQDDGKEDEKDGEGHPIGKLFVARAQTKAERTRDLKSKFQPRPDTGAGKAQGVNLYVKNLDENIDEEGLKELFASFGEITSAMAPLDDKGKCKGFGFVCFKSPDEATKAVTEMHLKVVKGKPLYVGLAEKKEARQERLRNRYQPGGDSKGKGGKGFKGGKG